MTASAQVGNIINHFELIWIVYYMSIMKFDG